jgi:hypothetical protein
MISDLYTKNIEMLSGFLSFGIYFWSKNKYIASLLQPHYSMFGKNRYIDKV